MIHLATLDDLSALVTLEEDCFPQDRFSRRIFRYLLTKAHGKTWVSKSEGELLGYTTVLFRYGSKIARLYAIAVHPTKIGMGVAARLLQVAETYVQKHHCSAIVLEVRQDNSRAIRFYEKAGYSLFGRYQGFYEDGMDALRFQKIFHDPHL